MRTISANGPSTNPFCLGLFPSAVLNMRLASAAAAARATHHSGKTKGNAAKASSALQSAERIGNATSAVYATHSGTVMGLVGSLSHILTEIWYYTQGV